MRICEERRRGGIQDSKALWDLVPSKPPPKLAKSEEESL